MLHRNIQLVTPQQQVVATGFIEQDQGTPCGRVDLSAMPPEMKQIFAEFEEVVNGQMLSFLDEVEGKIAALSLEIVIDGGNHLPVENLQIYPTTGDISFHLAGTSNPVIANKQ